MATAGRPLHYRSMDRKRRQVGEMRASYCAKSGKEIRRKEKKKNDSSPLFSARPGEEDDGAVSKWHRFAVFFFI